jgi:hypothetical protein
MKDQASVDLGSVERGAALLDKGSAKIPDEKPASSRGITLRSVKTVRSSPLVLGRWPLLCIEVMAEAPTRERSGAGCDHFAVERAGVVVCAKANQTCLLQRTIFAPR